MIRGIALALLGLFISLLGGCAVPEVKQAAVKTALDIPSGKDARPIQFKRIVVRLRRGEVFGKSLAGIFCFPQPGGDLTWQGGRVTLSSDDFTDVFREELQKYNYPIVGNPDALFEDPSEWKAELLVAGIIRKMEANICYPQAGFGNFRNSKGEAWIRVDWQIYSRLDRKVIHEVSTEGSFKSEQAKDGGSLDLLMNAFSIAVQNLLADSGFHKLVIREDARPSVASETTRINLGKKTNVFTRPITENMNDVRLGVVTVFAGGGHGSGFFIGGEGYVLTNEHVVRAARYVKVRLLSGREIVGEVVRTDSARDVALINVEERGIASLPIQSGELGVGEEVYAIGTPLDQKLSTTVSRGIISAYRTEDGKKLIRSDVTVLPGHSGGPLLDKNGNVLGLAVSGQLVRGVPAGVNFFIPIGDAIRTLGLE